MKKNIIIGIVTSVIILICFIAGISVIKKQNSKQEETEVYQEVNIQEETEFFSSEDYEYYAEDEPVAEVYNDFEHFTIENREEIDEANTVEEDQFGATFGDNTALANQYANVGVTVDLSCIEDKDAINELKRIITEGGYTTLELVDYMKDDITGYTTTAVKLDDKDYYIVTTYEGRVAGFWGDPLIYDMDYEEETEYYETTEVVIDVTEITTE